MIEVMRYGYKCKQWQKPGYQSNADSSVGVRVYFLFWARTPVGETVLLIT